jgi:hypothetical protein
MFMEVLCHLDIHLVAAEYVSLSPFLGFVATPRQHFHLLPSVCISLLCSWWLTHWEREFCFGHAWMAWGVHSLHNSDLWADLSTTFKRP